MKKWTDRSRNAPVDMYDQEIDAVLAGALEGVLRGQLESSSSKQWLTWPGALVSIPYPLIEVMPQ
jgi:hypothetical protein